VKVITPKWASQEEIDAILNDFKNECALMRKVAHPNVVLLMGVCVDDSKKERELVMVTQLMEVPDPDFTIHRTFAKHSSPSSSFFSFFLYSFFYRGAACPACCTTPRTACPSSGGCASRAIPRSP
jgi:hypothetical protein